MPFKTESPADTLKFGKCLVQASRYVAFYYSQPALACQYWASSSKTDVSLHHASIKPCLHFNMTITHRGCNMTAFHLSRDIAQSITQSELKALELKQNTDACLAQGVGEIQMCTPLT